MRRDLLETLTLDGVVVNKASETQKNCKIILQAHGRMPASTTFERDVHVIEESVNTTHVNQPKAKHRNNKSTK